MFRAADASSMYADGSKQLLIVSPNHDMLNPSTGTGTRLRMLAEQLSRNNDVYVLLPDEFATETPSWAAAVFGFSQVPIHYLTDLNPGFATRLGRILRTHDVDAIHVAQPKGVNATRMVVDFLDADVPVVYASQIVAAESVTESVDPDLPTYKRVVAPHLIPRIERWSVQRADHVTTVSERDRRAFIDRYDLSPGAVTTIPSGMTDLSDRDLADEATIRDRYDLTADVIAVFHGYYEHPPNRQAVAFIRDRLAPALRRADLDVEILFVGKEMPEYPDLGIRSAGFVEDLFSVLNAADIAVVPIASGGGTKTKIFDYMSLAIPVVTTEKGAQGIDLADDESAIISTLDESFVDDVRELVADADRRERLGRALRSVGERRYNWARSGAKLDAMYDDLVRGRNGRVTARTEVDTDDASVQTVERK